MARAHEYPVEGGAGGGRQLVEEVVGPRRHAHVTHQLRQLAIERPPAQIRRLCDASTLPRTAQRCVCARVVQCKSVTICSMPRGVTCGTGRPPARDVVPETPRALGATRMSNLHLMLSVLRREIIWPAAVHERHRGAPNWHSGGARPRRKGGPVARAATHDKRETLLHQIGSCMRQNN